MLGFPEYYVSVSNHFPVVLDMQIPASSHVTALQPGFAGSPLPLPLSLRFLKWDTTKAEANKHALCSLGILQNCHQFVGQGSLQQDFDALEDILVRAARQAGCSVCVSHPGQQASALQTSVTTSAVR